MGSIESGDASSGSANDIGGIQKIRSAIEMDDALRCVALERRTAGAPVEAAEFVLGGTLLQLWGDEHRRRRKLYAPLVSNASIKEIEAWLGPVIHRRLSELPRSGNGQPRADLLKLSRDISLGIAARIIGLDDAESLPRLQRLGELGDRLVGTIKAHVEFQERPGATSAETAADREAFIGRHIALARAAKQDFVNDYYKVSRKRREELVKKSKLGDIAKEELPKDLIMLMILNEEQMRSEPSWDEDLPVRECTMMLAASDHTTSMATCHAVADLFSWIERHPEDKPKLNSIAFLRAAIQESLRLHQITDPSPNYRIAKEEVKLNSGRRIAAEEKIAMWYGVGGLDAEYYGEDAHDFNPYRHEVGKLRRPYGFAFSGGTKVCLGQALVIGAGDGGDFKGDIPLMLQSFFEAGVRPDPDQPIVPKNHVYSNPDDPTDRREILVWESFPVLFNKFSS